MKNINQLRSSIINILSSRRTLYVIIILFILQSLWVAISFNFPMLFDERHHLGVINIFSNGLSPIIFNQPTSYDMYGNLTFGGASLFHYLMSFPSRFIIYFTNDLFVQVVILRVLNIIMVAIGFWIYAKVFLDIGIKQIYINISLFFFSLIPLVILLSATISYDNMLFPLTAGFVLVGIKIVNQNNGKAYNYMAFVAIGLFAIFVKITFLPVFIGAMVYVIIMEIRKYGKNILPNTIKSFRSINLLIKVTMLTVLFILFGLFIVRFGLPVVMYGSPIPACAKVLDQNRCLTNGVGAYELKVISTKNQRSPEPIGDYAQDWTKKIISQFDVSAGVTSSDVTKFGRSLPVLSLLIVSGVFIGIGCLLYAWRSMQKNKGWYFLIFFACTLIISVFGFNAMSYYSANEDLNTQGRYLLSIMPIILVMSLVSIGYILGNRQWLKIIVLAIVLLLSLQGGGVIKHILNSQDSWYWDNSVIMDANHAAKQILQPIVKETSKFD